MRHRRRSPRRFPIGPLQAIRRVLHANRRAPSWILRAFWPSSHSGIWHALPPQRGRCRKSLQRPQRARERRPDRRRTTSWRICCKRAIFVAPAAWRSAPSGVTTLYSTPIARFVDRRTSPSTSRRSMSCVILERTQVIARRIRSGSTAPPLRRGASARRTGHSTIRPPPAPRPCAARGSGDAQQQTASARRQVPGSGAAAQGRSDTFFNMIMPPIPGNLSSALAITATPEGLGFDAQPCDQAAKRRRAGCSGLRASRGRRGATEVDGGDRLPQLGRPHAEAVSGVDHERGADDEHRLGLLQRVQCAGDAGSRNALAEEDHRGIERPRATRAGRM